MKWQTNNINEFQNTAKEILDILLNKNQDNIALGFFGDLGVGKTTMTKIFAKKLGIDNEITSPTFTIMKVYQTNSHKFQELVHIDAYRIEDSAEVQKLKINQYFQKPNTLTIVEWPEKIKDTLPKDTVFVEILHDGIDPEKRLITLL